MEALSTCWRKYRIETIYKPQEKRKVACMFAKDDISVGELIFAETPFVFDDNDSGYSSALEFIKQDYPEWLDSLPYNLTTNCNPSTDLDIFRGKIQQLREKGVIIQQRASSGSNNGRNNNNTKNSCLLSLYLQMNIVQFSDNPNACQLETKNVNDRTHGIYAIKNIKKNEEICIPFPKHSHKHKTPLPLSNSSSVNSTELDDVDVNVEQSLRQVLFCCFCFFVFGFL